MNPGRLRAIIGRTFDTLRRLAFEYLDRKETALCASRILFWLMGNKLGETAADRLDAHPKEIRRYPVAILREELCSMYAIPAQIAVTEALMLLNRRKENAHLLVVGDPDQLPPIFHGDYVTYGTMNLFSSVFELYLGQPEAIGCKLTLRENFRMNEAISHYSADRIYDPELRRERAAGLKPHFQGFDEETRTGRLALRGGWETGLSEEERFVLDPAHNLVLVVLRGASPEVLAEKELELTVRYAVLLQDLCEDGVRNGSGKVTKNSVRGFWHGQKKGLAIVSPMRVHNESAASRLRDATEAHFRRDYISEKALEATDFFTGTVDALQGQEREAVIISYGVSDPARASRLGEFIYDRRRLNVALTRGRKKVILILTEALIDRPAELLAGASRELEAGMDFLCGLECALNDPAFMEEERKPEKGRKGRFFTDTYPPAGTSAAAEGEAEIRIYGHGYTEEPDN